MYVGVNFCGAYACIFAICNARNCSVYIWVRTFYSVQTHPAYTNRLGALPPFFPYRPLYPDKLNILS